MYQGLVKICSINYSRIEASVILEGVSVANFFFNEIKGEMPAELYYLVS